MDKLMPSSQLQSSLLTLPLTSQLVTSIGKLIQRCQDLTSPNMLRFWETTMIETSLPGELLLNSPSMLITNDWNSILSLTPKNGSKISETLIHRLSIEISVMVLQIVEESHKFQELNKKQSELLEQLPGLQINYKPSTKTGSISLIKNTGKLEQQLRQITMNNLISLLTLIQLTTLILLLWNIHKWQRRLLKIGNFWLHNAILFRVLEPSKVKLLTELAINLKLNTELWEMLRLLLSLLKSIPKSLETPSLFRSNKMIDKNLN